MNTITKEIGDREVGFKFSMLTLRKYSEKQQVEFYELFDSTEGRSTNPFSSYIALFQCAIMVYNKGKEPTEYEVDDLISEMSQADLQDVWNCCEQAYKDITDKMKIKGDKKKQPGEKS